MATNPRELPKNLHTLITPTGFPAAVAEVLRSASIPARKRRVYRIVYNNRYLWLNGNKTLFNTRPSAKDAVAYWVYRQLRDAAAASTPKLAFNARYGNLDRLLGGVLSTDTVTLICNYVKGLFDTGVLRLEETEVQQIPPSET